MGNAKSKCIYFFSLQYIYATDLLRAQISSGWRSSARRSPPLLFSTMADQPFSGSGRDGVSGVVAETSTAGSEGVFHRSAKLAPSAGAVN